jgi:N-acetylglucosamine kinase-like BadF-type ATPase
MTEPAAWIAVDGGQSGVRIRTSWTDREFAGDGFRHGGDGVDALLATVDPVLAGLDRPAEIGVVTVGHTGMPAADDERAALAIALAARLGAREVRLFPDWVTAHAGALSGRPGVVVSAGTGTACLGVGRSGEQVRVDGWGHLLGDAGSAYAIGRDGLDLAMRHLDGRAEAPALHAAAQDHLGADLVRGLWHLYSLPDRVDRIARFAPLVVGCAAAGDKVASGVVARAAEALATTVAAACRQLGEPAEVSYTGGLFRAGPALLDPFAQAVAAAAPSWRLTPPEGSPLDGSVRLARAPLGPFRSLGYIHTEPR